LRIWGRRNSRRRGRSTGKKLDRSHALPHALCLSLAHTGTPPGQMLPASVSVAAPSPRLIWRLLPSLPPPTPPLRHAQPSSLLASSRCSQSQRPACLRSAHDVQRPAATVPSCSCVAVCELSAWIKKSMAACCLLAGFDPLAAAGCCL
jgi:hypothetical protein